MKSSLMRLSGWQALPPNTQRLVLAQGLFTFANALSGSFVGVFLWRLEHRLTVVAQFHLMLFLITALAIQLATGLAKRRGSVSILIGGLGLYAAFYLFVLLTDRDAARWVLALGVVNGLALAFYAAGVNTLSYDLTEDHQRERYFSLTGILNTVASLVGPLVAGFLISRFQGLIGYRLVFTLTLLLFLVTVALVRKIEQPDTGGRFLPLRAWAPGARNPHWHRFLWAYLLMGWREGVFWFVMGVLLFKVLGSEWSLGLYLAFFAGLTVVAYWALGRFSTPARRPKVMRLGILLHVTGTLIATIFFNKAGIIAYMVLGGAVGVVVWLVPFTNLCFECIARDPEAKSLRLEYIAVRELPLGLGRVLGIGSFLLAAQVMPETAALRLLFPLWALPLLLLPGLAAGRDVYGQPWRRAAAGQGT